MRAWGIVLLVFLTSGCAAVWPLGVLGMAGELAGPPPPRVQEVDEHWYLGRAGFWQKPIYAKVTINEAKK